MKYRINRKTGDRISEIGIGSAYIYEAGMDEAVRALHKAVEGGVNYFDLAAGHGDAFPIYGEAFRGLRKDVFFQIHFGADYSGGEYGWSLALDTVKRSVEKQLRELGTDYIDYGFIHCQDEEADWETYKRNGVYDYILSLQKAGAVRHIGLSSHTPRVIMRIMDEANVDMLMFSVNPAYDYGQGEYANGSVDERSAVYRRCEAEDARHRQDADKQRGRGTCAAPAESEIVHDAGDDVLEDGEHRGQRGEAHEREEERAPEPSGRHRVEDVGQRDEDESRTLRGFDSKREARGDDDKARQDRDERVERSDVHRLSEELVPAPDVAAEDGHRADAQRQREERLVHRLDEHIADAYLPDLCEVGHEVERHALPGAWQEDAAHGEDKNERDQHAHHHL